MNVTVVGLWHMGVVTAAGLAASGHIVTGLDNDVNVIDGLRRGDPPVFEPGLDELIQSEMASSRLNFTSNLQEAMRHADVVWVTYDTPVDDNDGADVNFVCERIMGLFPELPDGAIVLISSQLPAGTTRHLRELYEASYPNHNISFGYTPENLQLGKALEAFQHPARIVVGLTENADQVRIGELLRTLTNNIEWMSVESAEMTKHALNAFLASSIVFANEIAILCEATGADAREVERGLKSDERIGARAYLSPGLAFSGGTLARDLNFLTQLGAKYDKLLTMLPAIFASNREHARWLQRKIIELAGPLDGKRIAIWGLTYKPRTDTLRRSASIELCTWLAGQGAKILAHDPCVKKLPDSLRNKIILCNTPLDACRSANALVVATAWPEYRKFDVAVLAQTMQTALVIDPYRLLESIIAPHRNIGYATIGKAR